MAGKSKRGKGKSFTRSKKKAGRQHFSVEATQQPVLTPSAPSGLTPPAAKLLTPNSTTTVIRYPYIVKELRTIGILAGVILVILVILALTFP